MRGCRQESSAACLLCGRSAFVVTSRDDVTGSIVTVCVDPLGCLEREFGVDGARLRVARLLSALRGDAGLRCRPLAVS